LSQTAFCWQFSSTASNSLYLIQHTPPVRHGFCWTRHLRKFFPFRSKMLALVLEPLPLRTGLNVLDWLLLAGGRGPDALSLTYNSPLDLSLADPPATCPLFEALFSLIARLRAAPFSRGKNRAVSGLKKIPLFFTGAVISLLTPHRLKDGVFPTKDQSSFKIAPFACIFGPTRSADWSSTFFFSPYLDRGPPTGTAFPNRTRVVEIDFWVELRRPSANWCSKAITCLPRSSSSHHGPLSTRRLFFFSSSVTFRPAVPFYGHVHLDLIGLPGHHFSPLCVYIKGFLHGFPPFLRSLADP